MAASVSCMGSLRVQQRAPASGSVRCQAGLKAQGQPAKAVFRDQQQLSVPNKLAAGMLGAAAALSLVLGAPAHAAEPFLKSTGARGPLVAEEERVLQLLNDREAEVQKELKAVRNEYEEEVRKARQAAPDDQLCATPFGIDVVGITEFIALTGALVGGVSARRRKQELERLNEQLRTINTQLRQQARAGTLYAPGLTYAPTNNGSMPPLPDSMWNANNGAAAAAAELTATLAAPSAPPAAPLAPPAVPAAAAPSVLTPSVSLMSQDDEETGPEAAQCTQALKDGKRLLKEGNAGGAMVRFEKALMLAKATTDRVKERRATRGLAACARMQGQLRQAVKHLERVLDISREIRDFVGDADAYGTIADIYTDLNDFDAAAKYYDLYISRMSTDSVV